MEAFIYKNKSPTRISLLTLLVTFNLFHITTSFQEPKENVGNLETNPYWHREILDTRGRYQLEWLVDWEQERVLFNVRVATRGWVGFGLARTSKMRGADIVIGGVTPNGLSYFSDRHAIATEQTILDKSQDWVLHSATESKSHTSLSFSRPFDTCDSDDIPINDDAVYLLWAYGERDNETEYHFENRGSFLTYLRDPDLTPRSVHEANRNAKLNGGEYVSARVMGAQIWSVREQFTIPAKRTTYWCTVKKFSRPLTTTGGKRHIIGYNVWINPTALQNMHHMLFYRCIPPGGMDPTTVYERFVETPGQECLNLGAPQGPIPTQFCTLLKLGHAIGGIPEFLPQHVGIPIGDSNQDEYYLLQTHYDNPNFVAGTINSSIQMDLYYTDNLRKNDGTVLSLGHHIPGSPSLLVPPGQLDHKIYGHCSPACTRKMLPPEGINFIGGLLHTHLVGARIRVAHFRNGRELPWIFNDDNYKFNFQPGRLLREDVTVLPGDQVTVQCYYDTTHRNRTTIGGYGTDQEMCKTFLLYYSPLADYPICRSEIRSMDYVMRYLAGTTNATWSNERLEYVATSPSNLAGMTLTEISDSSNVNWDIALRDQLRRDHIVHPQLDVCPNIRETAMGITAPPGFVSYPVQALVYEPPQRCALTG